MKYQVKYFDVGMKAKKTNGWEKSLLELARMMNGTHKDYSTKRTKART